MNGESKQKILVLIMTLVQLSNQAQEHGILSLDEVSSSLSSDFLKKAIQLMVEGFNEMELSAMLEVEIQSMESAEIELLEKQLIKEGVLLILRDVHGKLLFEKMLCLLGDEFFD